MEILATYDIATHTPAGQRRLARTAKLCEGYGLRVQNSVFECRLTNASHQRFINEALELINPHEDSFNLYRFPQQLSQARLSLGMVPKTTHDNPWIV